MNPQGTTQRQDWQNWQPGQQGDHLQEAQVLVGRMDPNLLREEDSQHNINLAIAYCLIDIADNLRFIVASQNRQQTLSGLTTQGSNR